MTELTDIGRMLAFSARPRETPGRDADYARLTSRYLSDETFSSAADEVFAGAGLSVTVDERDGCIVTASPHSPLRYSTADIVKNVSSTHRSVIGVTLLAVAKTAYPEPVLLDDPDHVAVFTTDGVVETLNRAATLHAEASDEDGDLDDEMVEVWRRWLALAETRPNAQRRSKKDRGGVVAKVCNFLVGGGYLTERGDVDGGTWSSRPRFRHAVIALTEDSELYKLVNGFDHGDDT